MTEDEIRQLADESYYHAQKLLLTTATPISEVVEARDYFVVNTGAPFGAFNLGMLKPEGEDGDVAIGRIEDYFKSRSFPYRMQLRDDARTAFEARLLEAGYQPAPETPVMVLREATNVTPVPVTLRIEEVATEKDLTDFRQVIEESYGMPAGMGSIAISDRMAAHPDTTLFLGRVDGEAACTSILVRTPQVAGIYMVGTAEAHRQRGFGAAITEACVTAGAREGAAFTALQASAMGRPVYARMGFEVVSTYHAYASPGSDPEAGFSG